MNYTASSFLSAMPVLEILAQPEASFYKEEGGRANTLSVTVGAPSGAPFPAGGPVRLVLSLCYFSCAPCVKNSRVPPLPLPSPSLSLHL